MHLLDSVWVVLRFLRLLLFKSLRPIGAGQDEAMYPIDQFHLVKVDHQPDMDIQELHVAQKLGLVDRA